MVFGLGWTPCIGHTLAAALALGLQADHTGRAVTLTLAYSIGLGAPFILVALGLRSSTRLMNALRKHRRTVMRIGGALLLIPGIALVTGAWNRLAQALQGLIAGTTTLI